MTVTDGITNRMVTGLVRELLPGGREVVVSHEEIPGYMAAMTMTFDVQDPLELSKIQPGDRISFRMRVTAEDGWIDQVKVLESGGKKVIPVQPTTRLVRDVDPLKVGDVLPDLTLTNHLGEPFQLASFEGRALAVTFIFTRCPYPDFCPRMNSNFQRVQKILKEDDSFQNWQLLSISFDPDYDTPDVLAQYASYFKPDFNHWAFATGKLIDIDALTEQFGLTFFRDLGTFNINHNLRTVVVDPKRVIRSILIGNTWKAEALAEALHLAATTPYDPAAPTALE